MIEYCIAHWVAFLIATLALEVIPFFAFLAFLRDDENSIFQGVFGFAVLAGIAALAGTATTVLFVIGVLGDLLRHVSH